MKNFADSVFEFGTLIKLSFITAYNSGYTKLDYAKNHLNWADKNVIRQFGLVLASLLALGAAGGIFYLTFFIDKCIIALGMIPEVSMVVQIVCLLLPTYSYYLRILIQSKKIKPDSLEEFINDTEDSIDPLIKVCLIHYQFESIHPFYDGNGRTGRILNITAKFTPQMSHNL